MEGKLRNPVNPVPEEFEPLSERVQEEDSETLLLYLPGFNKEQLKVQLSSNNYLRISGQRPLGEEKWSRFQKEYPVLANCDTSNISAKFEDGTLYVRQPKLIITVKSQDQPNPKIADSKPQKPTNHTNDSAKSASESAKEKKESKSEPTVAKSAYESGIEKKEPKSEPTVAKSASESAKEKKESKSEPTMAKSAYESGIEKKEPKSEPTVAKSASESAKEKKESKSGPTEGKTASASGIEKKEPKSKPTVATSASENAFERERTDGTNATQNNRKEEKSSDFPSDDGKFTSENREKLDRGDPSAKGRLMTEVKKSGKLMNFVLLIFMALVLGIYVKNWIMSGKKDKK